MKELLSGGSLSGFEYFEQYDALIGQVSGFSAAVRENVKTGSFGLLMWARREKNTDASDISSYIENLGRTSPGTVKNFRAADRGLAVALTRTGDADADARMLGGFLKDLTASMRIRGYKGCCYDCGAAEGLGIYDSSGVLIQCCKSCGAKYMPVKEFAAAPEPVVKAQPVQSSVTAPEPYAPEKEIVLDGVDKEKEALFAAMAAAAASVRTQTENDTPASVDDLLADSYTGGETTFSEERTEIKTHDDDTDLSDLMFELEEQKPKTYTFPEYTYDEESASAKPSERDSSLDSLMFVSPAEKPAEPENPFKEYENARAHSASAARDSEFDDLMYAGTPESAQSAEDDRTVISSAQTGGRNDSLDDLMYSAPAPAEPKPAPAPEQFSAQPVGKNSGFDDLMYSAPAKSAVSSVDKAGSTAPKEEDVLVRAAVRDEAGSDGFNVTELRDDSNDGEDIDVTEYVDKTDYGEDFDIEEIHSTANMPTDTSGEQLDARETPLEKDGSVPLINPNSDFVDRTVSSPDGPDAVEPLEMRQSIIGSEDMQTTAPPGYSAVDPRTPNNRYRSNSPVNPQAPPPLPDYNLPVHVDKIKFGSNPVFGIMGAIVLGTIGLVIWVYLAGVSVALDMGRISGLIFAAGCIAITAGVFGGYRLGGDELDLKGLVISTGLTVLMDIAGLFITFVSSTRESIEHTCGYNLSFFDAIEWTIYQFTDSSTSFSLLLNAGLTLLLMIVSLVGTIRFIKKRL